MHDENPFAGLTGDALTNILCPSHSIERPTKGLEEAACRDQMQDKTKVKSIQDPSKLCQECGKRPALFHYHSGRIKRDVKHTLCFRCFQSLNDAWHAHRLTNKKR
jgi:hypothetical protein